MDTPDVVPVVLSGGSGTRLWPASRPDTPKQLLPLVDHRTMLHATLDRVDELPGRRAAIIVCGESQEPILRSELSRAGASDGLIIVEPVARNTAPAVAVAALVAAAQWDDPVLLVMPADHNIADVEAFQEAIATGAAAAAQGHLVTFGVVPDHPATGYGYVEVGDAHGMPPGTSTLTRFIEKPTRQRAEDLLEQGGFLWNSGMFMFRASVYLAELERCNGAIATACRRAIAGAEHHPGDGDGDTIRLEAISFAESPSDSVDYAVMEKTRLGAVVPLDVGWNDVGSWASLYDLAERDADGNVVHGDVLHDGVAGSYLRSEGPLLTVVGVSNIVAVSTPDAVLVTHIDRTQDVRNIVAKLNEEGRSESIRGKRSPTAWGTSERLSTIAHRTVDQITINGGSGVTVKGDVVVVLQGSVSAGEDTGASGTVWQDLDDEIELRNPGPEPAIVLVVAEG